MTRVTNKFLPLLRALAITWFLLAQTNAIAHELSHDAASEPEVCATCSIGQVLQAGNCSSADIWPPVEQITPKTALNGAPLSGFTAAPPRARGPPTHS